MEFLRIQIPPDRTSGTRTCATQMLIYKFAEMFDALNHCAMAVRDSNSILATSELLFHLKPGLIHRERDIKLCIFLNNRYIFRQPFCCHVINLYILYDFSVHYKFLFCFVYWNIIITTFLSYFLA